MNTFNSIIGTNKRINVNPLKSLLYSSLVLITLLSVVSCGCENPIGPDNGTNTINTGTITPTNVGIPIERPLYIVSIPENSITKTVSIDTNILDLYLRKGYDPDEFSVTHVKGVDDGIIDVNALNFDGNEKTLQGTIALKQKLDFENPIDGGENSGDNDYEVAIFQVMSETSSNDFKLIVRITDAPDSKKLEILIDSYHLDDINQPRGLREIYLYEDSQVMDPPMGDDSNNFLIADLVESRSVRGDVDASTDLSRLYDQDDKVDAFLTATSINSNSNTYHRISLEFTEELYIQKVAIRGRQLGGYYGFVFILRDKEDRIIYVHQVSNPLSRGSGSEVSATSTYAFMPDYANFQIIDDYRIQMDNMYFNIAENTTDVLLIDNFFVVPGYEYERGFVSIDPGADFDKFNTDDLYFLDNELVGLSLKNPPDAEDHQDADGNGLYELGTVTITNFDRGSLTFALPVKVVNVPRTISLTSNQVSYRRSMFSTKVIEDLTTVVHISNFENSINLGTGTYKYQLDGEDAHRFRVVGNTLKTAGSFGFREANASIDGIISDDPFNVQVIYIPEEGTEADGASLNVSVTVVGAWRKITEPINDWPVRNASQIVSLTNGDILAMAGHGGKEIWVSQDGGLNWDQIALAPWPIRFGFQAVVTKNNKILMMGGRGEYNLPGSLSKNNIWSSSDGGKNWTDITPSNHWSGRYQFQAVALTNGDVLVIGGNKNGGTYLNDVWRSSDNGRTWSQIINAAPWSARRGFQAVVLSNNDILIMGGERPLYYGLSDVWRSQDGGTNWSQINEHIPWWRPNGYYLLSHNYWNDRMGFRTLVLDNGDIILMGGWRRHILHNQYGKAISGTESDNDVHLSRDGGVSWDKIHNAPWAHRAFFGAVALQGGEFLIIGGTQITYDGNWQITDSWRFENTNSHYQ